MIQNFGGGEILAIIILALVVLGPDRIPELARNAGKMIHKLKTMANGLQGQVQGVMDDPAMQPLRELGEFAARPRQKLAEYALEAEADERAKAEEASLAAADVPPLHAVEPTGEHDSADTTHPTDTTHQTDTSDQTDERDPTDTTGPGDARAVVTPSSEERESA